MVKIDTLKCIGCGVCQSICPDGFEIINGKAQVKNEKASCIEQAAKSCPKGAIILEGQNSQDVPSDFPRRGSGMGRGLGRGPRDGSGRGRGFGRGMRRGY